MNLNLQTPFYQDEICTIYHGNCLDVLPALSSADLVLTDPPYNVGYDYSTHDDSMTPDDYTAWCRKWFAECRRISRNAVALTVGITNLPMWIADIERTHAIMAWVKENQCSFQYIGTKSGSNVWEPVLIYGKVHKLVARDAFSIPISQQPDTGDHPCPKSLRAWKHLVGVLSDEGDTILDPFLGSGTTGVACALLGRKFIGIEVDPHYCELAVARIKRAQLIPCDLPRRNLSEKDLPLFGDAEVC